MRITRSTWKVFSSVCTNLSEVFVASVVLPPLVSGLDKVDWRIVSLGLVLAVFSIVFAVVFGEKGKV